MEDASTSKDKDLESDEKLGVEGENDDLERIGTRRLSEQDILYERIRKQTAILQDWEEIEDQDPTDPYGVLGVSRTATHQTIVKAYESRTMLYGTNEIDVIDEAVEAGQIIALRLRRAFLLLGDAERRDLYDKKRKERIQNKNIAKLRFMNGVYQGGVDPKKMTAPKPVPCCEGNGTMGSQSGEKHEGIFMNGKKHGLGFHLWEHGDIYVGQWQEDQLSGCGLYFHNDYSRYVGDFKDGVKHGEGTYEWPDGTTYTGQFRDGLRTGRGTLNLPKDSNGQSIGSYEGEWKDGFMNGFGYLAMKGEAEYKGIFENNTLHGEGRMEFPYGEIFNGQFNKGEMRGDVSQTWPNGDEYRGAGRNGTCHGRGTFSSPSRGLQLTGMWEAGRMQGHGKLLCNTFRRDGVEPVAGQKNMTYEGQFVNGVPHSKGTAEYPGGSKYTGLFKDGLKQGSGLVTYLDGSVFDGSFSKGAPDGPGSFLVPPNPDGVASSETIELWYHGELSLQQQKRKTAVTEEAIAFHPGLTESR
jgi:hypothetical protein